MRPVRDTIPMSDALARALDAAVPIARTERVRLDEASGRVLAAAVSTSADVPSFDRALMDGFAVIAADTAGASAAAPALLRSAGVIYTAATAVTVVNPGECVQIATGAPMPPGADAVVMVEETRTGPDGFVEVLSPVQSRQNVGRRGSDLQAGAVVLAAGALITPARLGALAAAGAAEVEVYARPAVVIASTGAEVVDPGATLGPGQIYDVNRHTLAAIVRMHGGCPCPVAAVPDTRDGLAAMLDEARGADLIVLSGGSSAGDRDLVLDAVRAAGEVVFHGISVKPGKPTLLGRVDSRPVLGMPGNPTSCLSNAYLLLLPMLRRMARLPEHRPHIIRAPLARRIVSRAGRHQFYSVRIETGAVVPAFKSSSDITSLSEADGYIEIAAGVDSLEAGTIVEVKLF